MAKVNRNNKKPNTINETQTAILVFLSQQHKDGRLNHGATQEAMVNFCVSGETIQQIWRLGRERVIDTTKSLDVSSKKKGRCGRKRKWDEEKLKKVKNISLHERQLRIGLPFALEFQKLLAGGS